MNEFEKGDRVRCLFNPYGPLAGERPAKGDVGTITSAGTYFVGVAFKGRTFKVWMTESGGIKTLTRI